MKIAVQLFGHLRSFRACAGSLRAHLLDRYPDHDVFMHTWDRLEHQTVTHHDRLGVPAPVDAEVIADLHRLYQPRGLAIATQSPRDLGELTFANGKRMAISGIAYMFESMLGANQLREQHAVAASATWDVVVAIRPDVALHRPLELERFLDYARPPNVLEDETARTRFAAGGPLPTILNDLRGFPGTDLLFFARPEVMTQLLTIGTAIHRYDVPQAVAPVRPQNLLNTHSDALGIRTAIIDYLRPRDFDIVRP